MLDRVLTRSRELGFLGPGPITGHIAHARSLARATGTAGDFLDLGSGGGVPGLVLLSVWTSARGVLLESNGRRAEFLEQSVAELGFADRAVVLRARAEAAGRDAAYRESQRMVTARSFGPPAVVAECGAPLLAVGGELIVSEPPAAPPDRWSEPGLRELGLDPPEFRTGDDGSHFAVLHKERPTPERFPRRVGIPAKRPLW